MTNEIKVSMPRHDNELLINSCANFGQTNSERAVARTHNIKINAIFKNRALMDIRTIELLSGICTSTGSCATYPYF